MGEKERAEGGGGNSPQLFEGRVYTRVLCLEAFISLPQAGILGEVSAECAPGLQVFPFKVVVSTDWSAPGSLVAAAGPDVTRLALLLFWAWGQHTTEAWMSSPGR